MTIKFITINILHGGEWLDKVLEFIDNEKPDIVAMQEVCESTDGNLPRNLRTTSVLKEHYPDYHLTFVPDKLSIKEGHVESGVAILSRYPIIKQEVAFFGVPYGYYPEPPEKKDFSLDPQNLLHATIDADGTALNVMNVHGVWGFDGEDNPRRLLMSEMIIKRIQGQANVILAGDFNTRPHTKTMLNLEKYLTNVFKDELKTTFNVPRRGPGGYDTSVVDAMYISKNIKVIEHYCPQVDISDHLPLVATLEV